MTLAAPAAPLFSKLMPGMGSLNVRRGAWLRRLAL
jgi:hypothetical protein